MTQDDDLDAMLAEGDDTVVIGGVALQTTVWTTDGDMGADNTGEGQSMASSSFLVRASLFPSLAAGDPVIVNGTNQRAKGVMRTQDGKVLHVSLGVF